MKQRYGMSLVGSTLILACIGLPCGAQSFDPPEGVVPARAFEGPAFSYDGPRDDGRRTLGAFGKNLGRNFIGVFSRDNLASLAIGATAVAASSSYDTQTQSLIKGTCQSCGTTGATLGGGGMVPVVGALFLTGRFSPQGPFRAATYDFAQALVVNAAYTGLLKYTVQRPRPDGSDTLSFPSGHASSAFSLATVANHHYGWRVGVPAYLLASGIGLSRVESNRHNLSDVVAGATIGIIVGRTVTRLDGERPARKAFLNVGPITDPHGQGVGIGVSAGW